ncbi:hypothetical protein ADUPG1_008951, partial [Aduncisulcus paluster]
KQSHEESYSTHPSSSTLSLESSVPNSESSFLKGPSYPSIALFSPDIHPQAQPPAQIPTAVPITNRADIKSMRVGAYVSALNTIEGICACLGGQVKRKRLLIANLQRKKRLHIQSGEDWSYDHARQYNLKTRSAMIYINRFLSYFYGVIVSLASTCVETISIMMSGKKSDELIVCRRSIALLCIQAITRCVVFMGGSDIWNILFTSPLIEHQRKEKWSGSGQGTDSLIVSSFTSFVSFPASSDSPLLTLFHLSLSPSLLKRDKEIVSKSANRQLLLFLDTMASKCRECVYGCVYSCGGLSQLPKWIDIKQSINGNDIVSVVEKNGGEFSPAESGGSSESIDSTQGKDYSLLGSEAVIRSVTGFYDSYVPPLSIEEASESLLLSVSEECVLELREKGDGICECIVMNEIGTWCWEVEEKGLEASCMDLQSTRLKDLAHSDVDDATTVLQHKQPTTQPPSLASQNKKKKDVTMPRVDTYLTDLLCAARDQCRDEEKGKKKDEMKEERIARKRADKEERKLLKEWREKEQSIMSEVDKFTVLVSSSSGTVKSDQRQAKDGRDRSLTITDTILDVDAEPKMGKKEKESLETGASQEQGNSTLVKDEHELDHEISGLHISQIQSQDHPDSLIADESGIVGDACDATRLELSEQESDEHQHGKYPVPLVSKLRVSRLLLTQFGFISSLPPPDLMLTHIIPCNSSSVHKLNSLRNVHSESYRVPFFVFNGHVTHEYSSHSILKSIFTNYTTHSHASTGTTTTISSSDYSSQGYGQESQSISSVSQHIPQEYLYLLSQISFIVDTRTFKGPLHGLESFDDVVHGCVSSVCSPGLSSAPLAPSIVFPVPHLNASVGDLLTCSDVDNMLSEVLSGDVSSHGSPSRSKAGDTSKPLNESMWETTGTGTASLSSSLSSSASSIGQLESLESQGYSSSHVMSTLRKEMTEDEHDLIVSIRNQQLKQLKHNIELFTDNSILCVWNEAEFSIDMLAEFKQCSAVLCITPLRVSSQVFSYDSSERRSECGELLVRIELLSLDAYFNILLQPFVVPISVAGIVLQPMLLNLCRLAVQVKEGTRTTPFLKRNYVLKQLREESIPLTHNGWIKELVK